MWKSNVKNIFHIISHVGLSEWSPNVKPRGIQVSTYHAHNRQSERQNIIDSTHTWQQRLVTISEDILTKYDFCLK